MKSIVEVKVTVNRKDANRRDLHVRYCIVSEKLKKSHTSWIPVAISLNEEQALDCALAILEKNLNNSDSDIEEEELEVCLSDFESDIQLNTTARGFSLWEFVDSYGSKCSIQKSSNAEADFIWFGVDEPFHRTEPDYPVRMHLSQNQTKKLIPLLLRFAINGSLEAPKKALDVQMQEYRNLVKDSTEEEVLEDETEH